jgi:hypothetical protein
MTYLDNQFTAERSFVVIFAYLRIKYCIGRFRYNNTVFIECRRGETHSPRGGKHIYICEINNHDEVFNKK